jgi:hypothetical protein
MKYVFAFCLAVVVSHGVLGAAPVTIVEDAESRATIVVAAGEGHAQQAAEAIQKYVEKMSGAKIDILQEGEESAPTGTVSIYVGHTVAAKKNGVEIPSGFDPSIRADAFEEEGYVLKTRGNSIFIGGNSDGPYRGTIYGAYAFLEKLGCRWYFPGEWGEIVPKRKTVTVPDLDVESKPDFPIRYISCGGWWGPLTEDEASAYRDWCDKVGFETGLGELYPLVGDGFLGFLLPAEEYYEEHPEYYAMNEKGERAKPDNDYVAMLCLSNPDVFTESVKDLKEAFADKQKGERHRVSPNGFGISPPDGTPYCHCEKCLANSQNFEYPDYFYGRQMSEEFFDFAGRLAKEFPDKWVATMAYILREMPPQGVKVPPNVTVMYAPISCCALHNVTDQSCWRRQEFLQILRQWRRQTPHVYLYEYNPNFLTGLFVPEPGTANAAANIPAYKEVDIKGISAQGGRAFMQTWTSFYVTAKLLWDSTTDVEALKHEFYTNFFGPEGGRHVRAWWDACEEAMGNAAVHVHEDFLVNHVYNAEFTQGIHKHVEAALSANLTDVQRERVEAFALIADHLEAYADMEEADKELRYADAAAAAQRMIDDEQKLHDVYSFFISLNTAPTSYHVKGRKEAYEKLAVKMNGEEGEIVAPLPLEMTFTRDRFNEGVIGEWYAPDFDDSDWSTKNTFYTWDAQDEPEDDKGHDHNGYGWYRGTFEVPAELKGKPISFHCGGAINEAWIWINGQYVFHSPHKVWWWHAHDFDIDLTDFVEAGKENTIAIRLWNKAEVGGLFRRGFFWSPTG